MVKTHVMKEHMGFEGMQHGFHFCIDTFCVQKYLEMEDAVEGEKKDLEDKVESLESIVRMLELKSKNAADHGSVFLAHTVEIIKRNVI